LQTRRKNITIAVVAKNFPAVMAKILTDTALIDFSP
jgi:hypothetical protein